MNSLKTLLFLGLASIPAWAAANAVTGIPNFHQVNQQIYRGGQPSDDSWQSLAKIGVKTVIDLRRPNEHDTAAERRMVEAAGLKYINVPMNGLVAPSDAQVSQVLAVLNSPSAGPVFVHCKKGMDRTGTIIACYRMSHDSWKNDKAMAEAKSLGLHWVELGMKRYIQGYQPAVQQAEASGVPAPAPAF